MSIGFFGLLTIVPAALSIILIVLFVLLKWNDNNKKIWTNKEGE
jgi:hypothetical protein